MNMTDSFFVDEAKPPRTEFLRDPTSNQRVLWPSPPIPPRGEDRAFDAWHCSKSRAPRRPNLMGETGLEDHPRTCKWLITPIYKPINGHLEG